VIYNILVYFAKKYARTRTSGIIIPVFFLERVVMGATESHIVEFQKGAAKISVDVPALPGHPPLKTSYISVKV